MASNSNETKIMSPLHLWIDADPSGLVWTGLDCDDDLALLAAISLTEPFMTSTKTEATYIPIEHERVILEGISICGGNAPLRHTTANMNMLLTILGSGRSKYNKKILDFREGYGWQSMEIAWKSLRYLNYIWPEKEDSKDASDAIIKAARALPPKTLDILMLGPSTNLAKALESEEWLAEKLRHVYLMGGEMTGQRLDLNTMSDRASTRYIIQEANVPVTMIPIQTCGQVSVTFDFLDKFQKKCCPQAAACAILPKMLLQTKVMPWLVNHSALRRLQPQIAGKNNNEIERYSKLWKASPSLASGFIPWDVVALLAVTHPNSLFTGWKWHPASVPSCENNNEGESAEPCDGTMTVNLTNAETTSSAAEHDSYRGWIRVPHTVKNETQVLQLAFDSLLCSLPAATSSATAPSQMLWGFLYPLLGIGIAAQFLMGLCLISCETLEKVLDATSILLETEKEHGMTNVSDDKQQGTKMLENLV